VPRFKFIKLSSVIMELCVRVRICFRFPMTWCYVLNKAS